MEVRTKLLASACSRSVGCGRCDWCVAAKREAPRTMGAWHAAHCEQTLVSILLSRIYSSLFECKSKGFYLSNSCECALRVFLFLLFLEFMRSSGAANKVKLQKIRIFHNKRNQTRIRLRTFLGCVKFSWWTNSACQCFSGGTYRRERSPTCKMILKWNIK